MPRHLVGRYLYTTEDIGWYIGTVDVTEGHGCSCILCSKVGAMRYNEWKQVIVLANEGCKF